MKTFRVNRLFFLSLFVIGCTDSDDNSGSDDQNNPSNNEKVVIFDAEYTGLMDLPMDEGGEHKAYPQSADAGTGLGFYAYTPGGYDENEHHYPLILFLHGSGERGTSFTFPPDQLDRVLSHGPPKLIAANNWHPAFPCLVVSPQTEGDWSPDMVHNFIKYLIENFRVNTQRIYLTGLSMGGRGCWFYEGAKGESSFAAALVPICGRGPGEITEELLHAPFWAFHGEEDNVTSAFSNNGSFQMVTQINLNNPKFTAKLTLFPEVGHNSWDRTYDNSGMGTENMDYDPFDQSIYDWMFQYRLE